MIAYADTVGPESTQKLPAVSKRTYLDKEGNPFNPKDEVDLDSLKVKTPDKSKIPVIGSDDPFITMPMHKIVSDKGEVVADVDTDAKVYLQNNRSNCSCVHNCGCYCGSWDVSGYDAESGRCGRNCPKRSYCRR